jgi:hypothetical protein
LTTPQPTVAPGRRRGRVLVILMLIAMALVTVVIVGGASAWRAYDRAHVIAATCFVTAAEGEIGSSTSGKGIGSSIDQVAITTKDCGPLVLRRGVTADNRDRIAAMLEAQGRTTFDVGAASFRFRKALAGVREPVVVFGFSNQPADGRARADG